MSDSDTPKYSRKKQDISKHKRALQSKCRWNVWVPVTLTLILVVCLYLRRHHSDVASGYWSHISAIKTSDQNLSYYYRDTNGRTLITPWTNDVDSNAPHPEYPRPQMQRKAWLNLNGRWEFDSTSMIGTLPNLNTTLKHKITVPFPVESYLSGVFQADASTAHMWYRRTFQLPPDWTGSRILLHFQAVDWQATVTVNGQKLGVHKGGYDKFSFDITAATEGFASSHEHELLVQVFDPTEFSHAPVGKQRMHPPRRPSSIFYTANSGIWQTVWLEPVPEAYVERLDLVPDVDKGLLNVLVHGSPAAKGLKVLVNASTEGRTISSTTGFVGETFPLSVPSAHLWSFDDPFLYDLDVTVLGGRNSDGQSVSAGESRHASTSSLSSTSSKPFHAASAHGLATDHESASRISETDLSGLLDDTGTGIQGRRLLQRQSKAERTATVRGGPSDPARVPDSVFEAKVEGQVDYVRAYFGMRKVSLGHVGGEKSMRVLLNDKFVFHIGMLDQGFWPDGIYTAPTDAALKYDIEVSKQMGFNMLRKHIKVEPDRWYYWADHLGILVWQDMPAMFWEDAVLPNPSSQEKQQFETEFRHMIQNHLSFPSIVMYVVFNEGWGQYETERVTKYAQSLDPTRLYNCASGWIDAPVGDLIDMHKYVGPGAFNPTPTRASVLGEFGGLGLKIDNHQWIPEDSFSYEMQGSQSQIETRYSGLISQISALMTSPDYSLCAAVYTELTDVEAEINGMLTYDRQVIKLRLEVTHKVHSDLLALSRSLNEGPVTTDQKQLKKALQAMMAPNKGEKGYVAPYTELLERAKKAQIPLSKITMPSGQQPAVEPDAVSAMNTPQFQQPDTFDAATKAAGHKVAGMVHGVWQAFGRSD